VEKITQELKAAGLLR